MRDMCARSACTSLHMAAIALALLLGFSPCLGERYTISADVREGRVTGRSEGGESSSITFTTPPASPSGIVANILAGTVLASAWGVTSTVSSELHASDGAALISVETLEATQLRAALASRDARTAGPTGYAVHARLFATSALRAAMPHGRLEELDLATTLGLWFHRHGVNASWPPSEDQGWGLAGPLGCVRSSEGTITVLTGPLRGPREVAFCNSTELSTGAKVCCRPFAALHMLERGIERLAASETPFVALLHEPYDAIRGELRTRIHRLHDAAHQLDSLPSLPPPQSGTCAPSPSPARALLRARPMGARSGRRHRTRP